MGNGRKVLLRCRNASFGRIGQRSKAMKRLPFLLQVAATVVGSVPVFAQSSERVIAQRQRQKEKLAREQKLREEEEDKSRLAVEVRTPMR